MVGSMLVEGRAGMLAGGSYFFFRVTPEEIKPFRVKKVPASHVRVTHWGWTAGQRRFSRRSAYLSASDSIRAAVADE
jgi:hypothetical protein